MSLVLHDCSKSFWQNRYCNHLVSSAGMCVCVCVCACVRACVCVRLEITEEICDKETRRLQKTRKPTSYLLRWRDCLKRDLRKAVGNEKWRENAYNREHGKKITKVAVQRNDE